MLVFDTILCDGEIKKDATLKYSSNEQTVKLSVEGEHTTMSAKLLPTGKHNLGAKKKIGDYEIDGMGKLASNGIIYKIKGKIGIPNNAYVRNDAIFRLDKGGRTANHGGAN